MTPEAQCIAIAEACGWTNVIQRNAGPLGTFERVPNTPLPDYLSDLNAMHEAEKVLTEGQREQYNYQLCHRDVVNGWFGKAEWTKIHATAAQRAEAFLRTLGKWDDAK